MTELPVDEASFRSVLGHFATGVTVVTAMEEGLPVGFTCQTFASLSLEPPMVALAPAKSSTSWPRIARAGAFCVNVLSEGQEELGRTFAVSGGDKFAGVDWRPGPLGAPVLGGSLAWVACELGIVHDAGDHELVTGRVRHLGVGAGGLIWGTTGQAIIVSHNGGRSWDQMFPAPTPTGPISAVSRGVAYGAGDQSNPAAILKTVNGGTTWQVMSSLGAREAAAITLEPDVAAAPRRGPASGGPGGCSPSTTGRTGSTSARARAPSRSTSTTRTPSRRSSGSPGGSAWRR